MRRLPSTKNKVLAHELVAKTAEDMAAGVYETMMLDNVWYISWKAKYPNLKGEALQRAFVKETAPGMLRQARATLAGMLRQQAYAHLHEQIEEALLLDNGFNRGTQQATIYKH